jgi:hypothetical protein
VSPWGRNGRITYIGINAHVSANVAHTIPMASHRNAPARAFFSCRSSAIKISLDAIQLCSSAKVNPQIGGE